MALDVPNKTRKNKQLVFIDDSGDPGFKKGASPTFVLAAALFLDSDTATKINKDISDFRNSLGWKENHEFKFSKASRKIKLRFLETVNQHDFKIYAVYIEKTNCPPSFLSRDEEKFYNWATRELLAIIPLNSAIVRADGKYGRKYKQRVKTYIRQELNTNKLKRVEEFDIVDSNRDNLIQLADIIVGSINRSLQSNKTDSNDYIRIIRRKIVKLELLDLSKY